MSAPDEASPPRPGWTTAAPWMGCSLGALARLYARHRCRIRPGCWLDAAIDLGFASANSLLGAAQALVLGDGARQPAPDDPLFILGHWRTGTTLVHELLALDERLRCPTTYECLLPHHFLLTSRALPGWTGFTLPGTRGPDAMPVSWSAPQEDEFALLLLGARSPYERIAFPGEPWQPHPALELDGLAPPERQRWEAALVGFARGLVRARPGRLAFKSPPHTARLPTLQRLFPRARYLNVVRDPRDVFPSTLKLWRSLCGMYGYQRLRREGLEEWVLATFARMHDRLAETRSALPAGAIVDLRYEDLLRDPAGELARAYDRLGLGDFEPVRPAVAAYFAARRADYRPNSHELPPPWREQVETRWRPYFQAFGY